jgi:hypothetical protein
MALLWHAEDSYRYNESNRNGKSSERERRKATGLNELAGPPK